MIGVGAVMINVIIIVGTFFLGRIIIKIGFKNKDKVEYKGLIGGISWGNVTWFELNSWEDLSLQVQGLASIIFCYVNHQLVFPLAFDLKNPTKKRLDKIFNRVHIVECIFYSAVGLTGYLLLVEHDDTLPIAPVVMASIQTNSMTIGKLFMLIALFFAVPLNLFPAKETIYQAFSL